MSTCGCTQVHVPRTVVLTGGPGAGKTAVLELVRRSFCSHVSILPEAAGVLFGGGFPRLEELEARKAAQRAIYYVQRELEHVESSRHRAVILCDRGTVDGLAYWPGPEDLWSAVHTSHAEQLSRYDAVIHLRTPASGDGYDHSNPLRIESPAQAAALDERIARAWNGHPRRFFVEPRTDFMAKASRALEILRAEVPLCCRSHTLRSETATPGGAPGAER